MGETMNSPGPESRAPFGASPGETKNHRMGRWYHQPEATKAGEMGAGSLSTIIVPMKSVNQDPREPMEERTVPVKWNRC